MTSKKYTEKQIESTICKHAKKNGYLTYKFVSPGCVGVPDRIFIKNGRVLFIEFKCSKGKATVMQQHHISKIMNAGVISCTINDIDVGKGILS